MSDSSLPSESGSPNLAEQVQTASQADSAGRCESRKCCRCCKAIGCLSCIVIALAVIVFLGWRIFTPKYTAKAFVRVAYQEKPLVFSSGEKPNEVEYEYFKNTQLQLIQNRFVLSAAIGKPEIRGLPVIKNTDDPVAWLKRNLSISFPGKSEVMEISLTSYDPDEAAKIVTAVVDAYMIEVVDFEKDQRRGRLSELDRVYTDKDQDVRNKRNELRQLAEQLGTAETETLTLKQKLTLEELATYRQELVRSVFDLGRLRSDLASRQAELRAVQSAEISDLECAMFAQNDPLLRRLFQEIMDRKMGKQYAQGALPAGEKSGKDAEKMQGELERLEKDYAERMAQIRDEIRHKRQSDVEKEIKRLEAAIEIANKQKQANEKDVDRLRKLAEQFGSSSVDVQMLRADIAIREKSLAAIANEREKLRVELRSPSRVIQLQKKAEAEKRPLLFWIP